VTNPANGTRAVSGDERALLRLLAAGLTDEAAARRLGISVRTARRQVAVLMDKLGASSRFQAGYRAAQRGWLLQSRKECDLISGPSRHFVAATGLDALTGSSKIPAARRNLPASAADNRRRPAVPGTPSS
jgi:DNA-binding CsgD family transcriptional regulator